MTPGEPRRVAITQSNYIPWKGYFDVIRRVDHLVLLDDVQYTRRDWRNRNKIKTAGGTRWLTIPVQVKGKYHQRIDETLIADPSWAEDHWRAIDASYRRAAPCFDHHAGALRDAYEAVAGEERLSDVNRRLIERMCALLDIDTPITWSTDYESRDGATERLLDICLAVGATSYLSGPAAQAYLDVAQFERAGIAVEWMAYRYSEYEQPHGPFEHAVSVVDLLLSTGPDAPRYVCPPEAS